MTRLRLARRSLIGLLAAAPLALVAAAPPATAQTQDGAAPRSATGCASNVCIYLSGNAGSTALVQAWARNDNFYGYFTVTGPNSYHKNSPTQTWYGHKGNYWSTSIPGYAGTWCVTGNSGQGTACEHLS